MSPLIGLNGLWKLDLSGTRVKDVSLLPALSGLVMLDLSGTGVMDVSALCGLSKLWSLDLSGTGVTDISAVSGLKGLHTLNLSETGITDVSALSDLSGLWFLGLRGTGVTDVSALSGLSGLQMLDLSGTGVTDVSALSGLSGLQTLDLSGTGVTDVSALSGLSGLQTLELSGTGVTDVSALSGLSNLAIHGIDPLAERSVVAKTASEKIDQIVPAHVWGGQDRLGSGASDTVSWGTALWGAAGGHAGTRSRSTGSSITDRVKVRFESDRDLGSVLRLESPGLLPRVVSRRRRFLSLSRPPGMSVDQFQSIVHQFSRGGRAQVLPDHQHTLEAIPTFDAGAQDGAEKAEATLDDVLHRIGANAVHNRTSGRGVTIAVVDTGVKGTRSEFPASKRVGGWSVEGEDPWDDDYGHGTMCACIAAATRAAGGRFQGVAPDAGLIACRTSLVDSELTDIYDLLADRAEAGEVIVATNSYGDPTPVSQDPDLLDALDRAIAAGVRFVFSAGNYHENVGGKDGACGPNSIWMHKGRADLLTAATCDLDGRMWHYSSRGPGEHFGSANTSRKPDVTAPTPRNGLILYGQDEKVMEIGWGTSGAAPQVAGLMALLLSLRPDLPRDDLFDMIRSTAQTLGFSHECQGFGLIDCVAAVDRLGGRA
ncbi:S8 family serine peptidase [Azospirillum rugosum]|uniref:S8 family serine peptidase n=1 Tax=Azospirillum rugosum TaxID=416170 RepID=UPI00366E5E09